MFLSTWEMFRLSVYLRNFLVDLATSMKPPCAVYCFESPFTQPRDKELWYLGAYYVHGCGSSI